MTKEDIIRPYDKAIGTDGSIAVLRGNLAPEGAVIKHTACPKEMFKSVLGSPNNQGDGCSGSWMVKENLLKNPSRDDASLRMEIDFLIAKSKITSKHNISPIEVKSGGKYTLTSLKKCREKYTEQLDTLYVLHKNDLKVEEGIVYLPLYMTPLLRYMKKKNNSCKRNIFQLQLLFSSYSLFFYFFAFIFRQDQTEQQ